MTESMTRWPERTPREGFESKPPSPAVAEPGLHQSASSSPTTFVAQLSWFVSLIFMLSTYTITYKYHHHLLTWRQVGAWMGAACVLEKFRFCLKKTQASSPPPPQTASPSALASSSDQNCLAKKKKIVLQKNKKKGLAPAVIRKSLQLSELRLGCHSWLRWFSFMLIVMIMISDKDDNDNW